MKQNVLGSISMTLPFDRSDWSNKNVLCVSLQSHDYTSYHNTMGRRSTLNPYTHMTNKYSYPTDHSLSSHYGGYNSWGLWRDSANLSLSALSSTKKRGVKSFSIILMTAAFIVVLAVLSVAGLAFYFSTFRSEMDDCEYFFHPQTYHDAAF